MSDIPIVWRSFAGGEITPELYARFDLAKNQTGLSKCLNFITLAYGPATNRTGLAKVIHTKYPDLPSRLVPFIYSDEERYVLELGDHYIRFHVDGGTLIERHIEFGTVIDDVDNWIKTISAATPASVLMESGAGWATGDTLYITNIQGGVTELNGLFFSIVHTVGNNFQLYWPDGMAVDGTAFDVASYVMNSGRAYRVYELETPYSAEDIDLLEIEYAQDGATLVLTHKGYAQHELTRQPDWDFGVNWTLTPMSFDPVHAAPTGVDVNPSGDTDMSDIFTKAYTYVVTAVIDGQESVASTTASTFNALYILNHRNLVQWDAVADASHYNVYRQISGVFAFVGQSQDVSFEDDNIVPDYSLTPPEPSDEFDEAGEYPAAVTHFEQRRVFAGSENEPSVIWMTKSGTDFNMSRSIPSRDDDALAFRVKGGEFNDIRHMVPLEDLLALTGSGVWRVYAKSADAITPTTIGVKRVNGTGASKVRPIVIDAELTYSAARGSHVMALEAGDVGFYKPPEDRSLMAQHLFERNKITDEAYQAAPYRTRWSIRDDGKLLGMTYVPKHDVWGWHVHETDGVFESVAVIPEGTEDGAYFIVRRTIDGSTVRFIEKLHSPFADSLADAFYVDCGVSYEGNPATRFYVPHLRNKTVAILADGAVQPQQQVSADGWVTLEQPASKVHAGLPYMSDLETLPLSYEAAGFGQGVTKNINKVHLRVKQSSGIQAGPAFDKLTDVMQRTGEEISDTPLPVTGVVDVILEPQWSQDGSVCVRQSNPLPLTVLSMGLEVALGD